MAERFGFAAMPRLQTGRLTPRAVSPEHDLPAWFELFADPQVAEYTDTGPFATMAEAAEVMAWISSIFDERRGLR